MKHFDATKGPHKGSGMIDFTLAELLTGLDLSDEANEAMTLDWAKPIQFENGQPCRLLETNANGWRQWGARKDGSYPTRMIHRLGIDETSTGGAMSAYWWMHEDGKSNWPGYNVVNKPKPVSPPDEASVSTDEAEAEKPE